MKRYIIAVFLFYLVLLFSFSVYAFTESKTISNIETTSDASFATESDTVFFDRIKGDINDYITVVNDYGIMKNGLNELMIIKNISETPVSVHAIGIIGEMSESEGYISVLGPDETSVLHLYYPEIVDGTEVDMTHQFLLTQPVCEPVLKDVNCEMKEGKIIVKNNSEFNMLGTDLYSIEFVDGEAVDFSVSILGNEKQIISPGEEVEAELPYNEENTECYLYTTSQRVSDFFSPED